MATLMSPRSTLQPNEEYDSDFLSESENEMEGDDGRIVPRLLRDRCCPLCDRRWVSPGPTADTFDDHIMARHADIEGKFFTCAKCPKFHCRTSAELRHHFKASKCNGWPQYYYWVDPKPAKAAEEVPKPPTLTQQVVVADGGQSSKRKSDGSSLLSPQSAAAREKNESELRRGLVARHREREASLTSQTPLKKAEIARAPDAIAESAEGDGMNTNEASAQPSVPLPIRGEKRGRSSAVYDLSKPVDETYKQIMERAAARREAGTCNSLIKSIALKRRASQGGEREDAKSKSTKKPTKAPVADKVPKEETTKSTTPAVRKSARRPIRRKSFTDGSEADFEDEAEPATPVRKKCFAPKTPGTGQRGKVAEPHLVLDMKSCPLCALDFNGCVSASRFYTHFHEAHRNVPGSIFSCSECPSVKHRHYALIQPHFRSSNCGGRIVYAHDPNLAAKPRGRQKGTKFGKYAKSNGNKDNVQDAGEEEEIMKEAEEDEIKMEAKVVSEGNADEQEVEL